MNRAQMPALFDEALAYLDWPPPERFNIYALDIRNPARNSIATGQWQNGGVILTLYPDGHWALYAHGGFFACVTFPPDADETETDGRTPLEQLAEASRKLAMPSALRALSLVE